MTTIQYWKQIANNIQVPPFESAMCIRMKLSHIMSTFPMRSHTHKHTYIVYTNTRFNQESKLLRKRGRDCY